jgi:hypothetical protein
MLELALYTFESIKALNDKLRIFNRIVFVLNQLSSLLRFDKVSHSELFDEIRRYWSSWDDCTILQL